MTLPHIEISLNESLEVVITHVLEVGPKPIAVALNSVDLFNNGQVGAEARLGAIVLAILENWHGDQFKDMSGKTPPDEIVFDDHYIIQELISKSVQQKTKGYINAIVLLLKGKEGEEKYSTLLSTWPDIQRMFEKYPN